MKKRLLSACLAAALGMSVTMSPVGAAELEKVQTETVNEQEDVAEEEITEKTITEETTVEETLIEESAGDDILEEKQENNQEEESTKTETTVSVLNKTSAIGTGVYKAEDGGFYYYIDGQIADNYNGFAENQYGWWYLENSRVVFSKNDVIKGTVNGETAWWYVKDGQVSFVDTLAKNSNGWWRIENGKVNFGFKGFANNENGWFYLEGGKVQFSRNGVIKGTVNDETDWWYVKNGQIHFIDTLGKNSNGWWRIENGKVNFGFKGFANNENGWFYLEGGKVQFSKSEVIKGTVNGVTAWWNVTNGKVSFTTTFAKNANGWFYIENGKVNFSMNSVLNGTVDGVKAWWYVKSGAVTFTNTVAKNSSGWWCIQNGKVNFNFTGIASNSSGNWYCKNGKVDFSYSGTITYSGRMYKVVRGQATLIQANTPYLQTLARAQAIVDRITTDKMSKEEKLKVCFEYTMTWKGRRPRTPHYYGMDWPIVYANDMFVDGSGNCFSYAAAFAFMAKAIGYDEVYCCNSGGHGWAEINGLVYDPEETRNSEYTYYGISYDAKSNVNFKKGLSGAGSPGNEWMHVKI